MIVKRSSTPLITDIKAALDKHDVYMPPRYVQKMQESADRYTRTQNFFKKKSERNSVGQRMTPDNSERSSQQGSLITMRKGSFLANFKHNFARSLIEKHNKKLVKKGRNPLLHDS